MPERDETRVVVIAHFKAQPGKQQQLSEFLKSLVEPTRAEPGCLRYELNENCDEPGTFSFVETFADRKAFDAHCGMPYIHQLFEQLPQLVEKQYIGLHHRILP